MIICLRPPMILPKVVAIAWDKILMPTNAFPDPQLPGGYVPKYGQDFTFGVGGVAPLGHDVGKTETVLKPKMQKLLTIFADKDTSGMANRLFAKFLAKQTAVTYFDDRDLNLAAAAHENVKDFCGMALSAPNTKYQVPGKMRIHQALKQANWDIMKMNVPTDLGAPAFDKGRVLKRSGDFRTGLGVMVNAVQWVFIVATHYEYDKIHKKYGITLRFLFYDVFGLDDDDLKEFGAKSDDWKHSDASVGITAWWQLQHQQGYAPLVTRIVVENTYEVPAI